MTAEIQALAARYPSLPVEGFRLGGRAPQVAIAPGDASGVAEALHSLAGAGLACVPWGGGVQQDMGHLPTAYHATISTSNLAGVVDVQPGDLTVTVQAGMTLDVLQDLLRKHGQFVALESRAPARETIGGLLAAGSSALLRHAYGGPRDQVIGIAVAIPDGSVVRGGGRVVKNVAGYDLCKLFTGSLGTLGIIVEATFKVRPLPQTTRTWIGLFPSASAVEEAAAALLDSDLQPSFLQALDPALVAALLRPLTAGNDDAGEWWALALGADGVDAFGQWSMEEASRLAHAEEILILNGVQDAALREGMVQACGPEGDLCVRVSLLSSDALGLMDDCRQRSASAWAVKAASTSSVGAGVVYFNFDCGGAPAQEMDRAAAEIVAWLGEQAARTQGSMAVLRCPPSLRDRLPMWGPPAPAQDLMEQIRDRLDPSHVLNRGRLFRGIITG